jgi:hypothetical protein
MMPITVETETLPTILGVTSKEKTGLSRNIAKFQLVASDVFVLISKWSS